MFDFHPAEVDKAGNIQIHSAAILHFMERPEEMAFAPSPALSRDLDLRFCDHALSELLSKAWHKYVVQHRMVRLLRPIFRSLEVAYQAAAIPSKNVGSIHDFGLAVAHWVSALETLLWPLHRDANQRLSVLYLAQVRWLSPLLSAKRYTVAKKTRGTAAQKACQLMYRARNAFLHGDHFAVRHLVPFPARDDVALPALSAVVYRGALVQRLTAIFPYHPDPLAPERIAAWFADSIYEEAFERAFGLESA